MDGFNIDLRAATLNNGSFQNIPRAIRARAQRECEAFIEALARAAALDGAQFTSRA
jgi:hypothetical protein